MEKASATIQTPRLDLRPLQAGDTSALFETIFSDPEVMLFSDGVMSAVDEVEEWIQRYMQQERQKGHPVFVVRERGTSTVLGYVGLFDYDDINGSSEIEIGYRIKRSVWGKGLATEATRAVVEFANSQLGLNRLVAMVDPRNYASIAVARKLGMHQEDEVMFPGYDHPDLLFVMSR